MNIYLISQDIDNGYDTYDSAIVIAKNKKQAAKTHPSGYHRWDYAAWVGSWKDVTVKLIGVAKEGSSIGVVCSSFNAG